MNTQGSCVAFKAPCSSMRFLSSLKLCLLAPCIFHKNISGAVCYSDCGKCHPPIHVRVNGVGKQGVLPAAERSCSVLLGSQTQRCRSALVLQVLLRCFAHTSGCAWGREMPEYTNVVLSVCNCPNQSSGTAWRAEELCTPQKSVINCRVKGVQWLLSVNYQFLLQLLWRSLILKFFSLKSSLHLPGRVRLKIPLEADTDFSSLGLTKQFSFCVGVWRK